LNSWTLPDESLIDEMRAALRSDRERAESRHSRDGAATPAVEQPPASPAQLTFRGRVAALAQRVRDGRAAADPSGDL
jgi:hypothetical protein